MEKCPELANSPTSQYGFKSNSSTQHAEFVISETIKYYNKKGSNVYLCSLDAEKAFDSCHWGILFEKLYYEKGIPLPVVKVIQSIYQQGLYQVHYNGNLSYQFSASQGVFQGSILSPHLYNDYTESLLEEIEHSTHVGTSLYGCYAGIIAYADDIILMSPTVGGLQTLLDKCMEYFGSTAINLNVDKTEFITSGPSKPDPVNTYLSLDGHFITPQNSLKHLGFIWNVLKSGEATINDTNVKERTNKFWAVVYSLIKGGVRYCNPESIVELYQTLAVPTLTYGLELCSLSERQLQDLNKEGRKAIKQLFNISKYSRNHLNTIFNIDHVSTVINNNRINLFTRLMKHEGTKRIVMSNLCESPIHRSFVGETFRLANSAGINFFNMILCTNTKKLSSMYDEIPEETVRTLQDCCKYWNVASKRTEFRNVMEERIPAPLD